MSVWFAVVTVSALRPECPSAVDLERQPGDLLRLIVVAMRSMHTLLAMAYWPTDSSPSRQSREENDKVQDISLRISQC